MVAKEIGLVTSNADLFRALCKLGERLVGLHLREQVGKLLPAFNVKGNNLVEKILNLSRRNLNRFTKILTISQYYLSLCFCVRTPIISTTDMGEERALYFLLNTLPILDRIHEG